MKILLVGGLGFIGKRFIRKYGNDYQIIVFARKDRIKQIPSDSVFKTVIYEEGNIEDSTIIDVISKHKPDVVIHLAALTGLKKCHNDPDKAFRVNVFGTHNVITGCVKNNSKLIFISSREVYGETKSSKSSEEDELKPNNVYGLTKLLGESIIKNTSLLHNLDYTILRITNVYGPEGDGYGAQIMIKDALNKKKIKIFGGTQRLNYIFVDDIVEALGKVLENPVLHKQIFNLGSEDTLTVDEFVSIIKQNLDFSIIVEHLPMRETETTNFKPDLEKIKNVLSFKPMMSLEMGLKKTIEWYSNYQFSY